MEANRCSVSDVFGWVSSAWSLYKQHWFTWTAMFFCFGVLSYVIGLVPVLGAFTVQFIQPLLIGGFFMAADRARSGTPPSVRDLFLGGVDNQVKKALYVLGIFSVTVFICSAALMGGAALGSIGLLQGVSAALLRTGVGFGLILGLLLSMAGLLAMWYAIPLVTLGGQKPIDSLKTSLFGSLGNFIPLVVFGLLTCILVLGGMLAFMIGVFFTAPIAMLANYYSYLGLFNGRVSRS